MNTTDLQKISLSGSTQKATETENLHPTQLKVRQWLEERLQGNRPITAEMLGRVFGILAGAVKEKLTEEQLKERVYAEYTVSEVANVHASKFETGKLEIGDVVIDVAFGGNADLVLSEGTEKPISYAEICKHEKLPFSPRTLNKYTRAAALKRQLEKSEYELPHLSASHYEELAVLKSSSDRFDLAEKANEEEYSVRKLREVVEKKRKETGELKETAKAKLAKAVMKAKGIKLDKDVAKYTRDKQAVKRDLPGEKVYAEHREATKTLKRIKAYVQVFDEYVASLNEIIEDEEREEGVDDLFLEEDNDSEADPDESHDVA